MTIHQAVTVDLRKRIRQFRYSVLILSLLFAVGPFAGDAHGRESGKHFLWAVSSGKNTSYVVGSIHILKKDSYPLSEEIENVYACCAKVVFETDLDGMNEVESQNRMIRSGTYPHGQTFSQNLSQDTYRTVEKRMKAAGLPVEHFEQFKPWFVLSPWPSPRSYGLGMILNSGSTGIFSTGQRKIRKGWSFWSQTGIR